MLIELPYNRERAVAYARRWALSRNPLFFDFTGRGGNCTNFVSQCLFAGCGVMNDTPTFGWYYRSPDDRAPAWSGVEELARFLLQSPSFLEANGGQGPYAVDARTARQIEIGDVIQLGSEEEGFYHTLLVVGFEGEDPLVAAQTNDAYGRPLSTYEYDFARYIKILGVRLEARIEDDCFESVLEGVAIVPPSSSTEPII